MRTRITWTFLLPFALALILVACGEDDTNTDGTDSGQDTTTATMDANMPMASPDAEADPDLQFIDAMIIHHQSAVEMAQAALEGSERQEIRGLAAEIIEALEQEIEQLRRWRDDWYPDAPESDISGMMGMAGMNMTDADMEMLRNASDFDQMFIDMMIPHHEAAIQMAESLQQTTERPELLELTGNIIEAQESEIERMRQWREEWYGQ